MSQFNITMTKEDGEICNLVSNVKREQLSNKEIMTDEHSKMILQNKNSSKKLRQIQEDFVQ